MQYQRLPNAAVIVAAAVCIAGAVAAHAHDTGQSGSVSGPTAEEGPFLAENAAAMDKMMAGMNMTSTGNIDADFTAMMIPHHQGAIDMAVAYLKHGKNPQLARLAQEIIVDQQQEIAAMRLALGQPLPLSVPAPTEPAAGKSAVSNRAPAYPAHGHSAASHDAMQASSAVRDANRSGGLNQ